MQLLLFHTTIHLQKQRKKGRDFESRKDEESNQAMFEIAETFLQSEDLQR